MKEGERFVFACYRGLERSAAATAAYQAAGYEAQCFVGGMKRLVRLCETDIRAEIPPQALMILIRDQGNSPETLVALEQTQSLLAKLAIHHSIKSTPDIMLQVNAMGLNPCDFFS